MNKNKNDNSKYKNIDLSNIDIDKIDYAKALKDANVNHPSHYCNIDGIECIDVAEHFNFNIGNAIKYLWRAGLKAEDRYEEDLRKAIWYIKREISRVSTPVEESDN